MLRALAQLLSAVLVSNRMVTAAQVVLLELTPQLDQALARLVLLELIPQVVRVFAVRVRQASILRVLVKQLAPTVLLASSLLP